MPLENVKPKIKDLKTTGINVKKEKFPCKVNINFTEKIWIRICIKINQCGFEL